MRLLPVAQRLRADGHVVLIASRDMHAAATVLGRAGIPFVQAPHLPKGIPLLHRATGYADILLSQGWSDASALWGLTHAWLNLFRMFGPEQLILDYSPTASLAAWIAKIPCLLVGNGFELPPMTDPLPPFPGFSWATAEKAARSERVAVQNANAALNAFRSTEIIALRDLVVDQTRLFATFPELDHYGARPDAQYIGPLLGDLDGPRVEWPAGEGPKVFACLRPDTARVQEILGALAEMTARVVCVAPGFSKVKLEPFIRPHIRYALMPINLQPLLDADLCVTYGAEGTMMTFVLAGVPQLISPWHVETYMVARRVETSGIGASLGSLRADKSVEQVLQRLATDTIARERIRSFAHFATSFKGGRPADRVIGALCRS